jgi:exodeoxyribonuclease VII small subunit
MNGSEIGESTLADAKSDPAKLSFEDALKELEDIVSKLEGGQVSLEQSIAFYERGEKLKQRCEALLKDAEMRIEKITLSADGKPKGTEPLDVER